MEAVLLFSEVQAAVPRCSCCEHALDPVAVIAEVHLTVEVELGVKAVSCYRVPRPVRAWAQ